MDLVDNLLFTIRSSSLGTAISTSLSDTFKNDNNSVPDKIYQYSLILQLQNTFITFRVSAASHKKAVWNKFLQIPYIKNKLYGLLFKKCRDGFQPSGQHTRGPRPRPDLFEVNSKAMIFSHRAVLEIEHSSWGPHTWRKVTNAKTNLSVCPSLSDESHMYQCCLSSHSQHQCRNTAQNLCRWAW